MIRLLHERYSEDWWSYLCFQLATFRTGDAYTLAFHLDRSRIFDFSWTRKLFFSGLEAFDQSWILNLSPFNHDELETGSDDTTSVEEAQQVRAATTSIGLRNQPGINPQYICINRSPNLGRSPS